ncbi:hypothetical protein TREMEDRAFT_59526 [Tremella mesenterica DSM 1558]|uniref:uncharacterized protein n=1 Tax=Tremella mesenterica (strain ATCC 24925 / CBS 8224 / DSM 1558 / NBRC 9311 / NRRL Y-6157 / RJB 2259-6 / UBC 559-6) TaxID=578456 RepID=UPI0003F49341|nr:uncharacterized protein TREMEDRAFT_59526 [Tremella mesenterica DSM 1558]EIW73361.1 hypothetical protein TREMEDRAFT_59526 [Tremella mesenterica DSM 1558]
MASNHNFIQTGDQLNDADDSTTWELESEADTVNTQTTRAPSTIYESSLISQDDRSRGYAPSSWGQANAGFPPFPPSAPSIMSDTTGGESIFDTRPIYRTREPPNMPLQRFLGDTSRRPITYDTQRQFVPVSGNSLGYQDLEPQRRHRDDLADQIQSLESNFMSAGPSRQNQSTSLQDTNPSFMQLPLDFLNKKTATGLSAEEQDEILREQEKRRHLASDNWRSQNEPGWYRYGWTNDPEEYERQTLAEQLQQVHDQEEEDRKKAEIEAGYIRQQYERDLQHSKQGGENKEDDFWDDDEDNEFDEDDFE